VSDRIECDIGMMLVIGRGDLVQGQSSQRDEFPSAVRLFDVECEAGSDLIGNRVK
jgi:hypothetical protein